MQTIIGFIAVPLGWLLSYIYSLLNNYGITLIIFTIFVKGCLYPLYAAQIKSTSVMADIQPKIQALQKKYANDKETLNIKMMELYKEEKFNPMGGCLPMLIQMPIIFGLFALLRNPMAYISSDSMLLAIHESFLWVMDLSQPDLWILPIAAGVTTFISFNQTQSQQGSVNNQMAPMMNMMKYLFPVMIVWMGRSFPAGLTIYWFIGTLVQIGFNFRLNKLRKKMKEQSGRNRKK
ncbi:YidC/Oxa1 family membrane protein insertase [Aminipila sp.]|jgi:YidC/Oxa1 family membrane protein insertase|uniref:YidC/Oxa1 family membrane protein insertase n=1 Tax=Aminipila sp. TaxID=2060095 RepID=UPI00289CC5C8|nr:YidC/Oxa1 family membrane protein insertase [Aminipila sp.]